MDAGAGAGNQTEDETNDSERGTRPRARPRGGTSTRIEHDVQLVDVFSSIPLQTRSFRI